MEPASTVSVWAKVAAAVKDSPLWLLAAIALSLTAFLAVPQFYALVSSPTHTAIVFAAVVAWILVATRGTVTAFEAWRTWHAGKDAKVKFVITPISHECYWGGSWQRDGSFVTQVSGRFMVKNRTDAPLHLMTAALTRPKIKGEALPGLLTMRALDSNMHGTAHVSGNFVPAKGTLPVSSTILIRGMPKQRSGSMDAVIEMADADGNRERVRLSLRCLSPISTA